MPKIRISLTQTVQYSRDREATDEELAQLKSRVDSSEEIEDMGELGLSPDRDAYDCEPIESHDINISVRDGDKWKDAWAE